MYYWTMCSQNKIKSPWTLLHVGPLICVKQFQNVDQMWVKLDYAKRYLVVGPAQTHEYHQILTNVSINCFG